MSGIQAFLVVFAAIVLLVAMYVGFRLLTVWIDRRFPPKPEPVPQAVHAAVTEPSRLWWEELQALRSQFSSLQAEVAQKLAAAQLAETAAADHQRRARNAEERARRLRAQEEDEYEEDGQAGRASPALLAVDDGWEPEVAAPAGQPVPPPLPIGGLPAYTRQQLEKRRATL